MSSFCHRLDLQCCINILLSYITLSPVDRQTLLACCRQSSLFRSCQATDMQCSACSCGRQAVAAVGRPAKLGASSAATSSTRAAPRRRMRCNSTDPAALQDVIVGGAVTAAVGAALFSGLKKEPRPCELCAGNGGIRCFACQGIDLIDPGLLPGGSGSSSSSSSSGQQQQQARPKRDIVGRAGLKPGACRVCAGTGLVLCSKCKGSGYISSF